MFEFHALYKTVAVQDAMVQNAANSIKLLNDDVVMLHYVCYAWQSVP